MAERQLLEVEHKEYIILGVFLTNYSISLGHFQMTWCCNRPSHVFSWSAVWFFSQACFDVKFIARMQWKNVWKERCEFSLVFPRSAPFSDHQKLPLWHSLGGFCFIFIPLCGTLKVVDELLSNRANRRVCACKCIIVLYHTQKWRKERRGGNRKLLKK